MGKISPIKENILYFIDNQRIKKEEFYQKTEISASNFKGVGLKSEIGGDKIAKILSIYPIINPEWLLTGKGSMLRENNTVIDESNPIRDKLILRQDQLIEHLERENQDLKKQLSDLKKDKEPMFHSGMVAEPVRKLEEKLKK